MSQQAEALAAWQQRPQPALKEQSQLSVSMVSKSQQIESESMR